MALIRSLPETAHLADLFGRFPNGMAALMSFIDSVMREESPLTVGERELIATYVSSLNACTFCAGSHEIYAEAFGIEEGLVAALLDDIDSAPVEDKLKPLFHYVKKLTVLPSKLVQRDADAVYDAGWDDEALYSAIQVCGLFNMMNRLVEGSGVNFDYADDASGHPVSKPGFDPDAHTYASFGKRVAARSG
ncbi:MAG: peroxidase-related enzyme [Pseudomonadota bacterium]